MEVEIKARVDSLEDVERRISEIGGTFIREVVEEDVYYRHPCRDFSRTDEALRIRNDSSLTYKGPKVDTDTKSREEHIIHFDSEEEMKKILESLGFKPVAVVRKRRRYYRIGDVIVSLDSVEELGNFVEVECIGEYEKCRKRVLEVANILNLSDFERRSYLELLLAHRGTT